MTKCAVIFFAVVLALAASAAARELAQPYEVTGRVYCDTCQCGFETNVTNYIPGATVDLVCTDDTQSRTVYRSQTVTDKTGTFKFVVNEDHGEQVCDVVPVESPWEHCKVVDSRRSKSRVIVTDANGIKSNHRYANNLGFIQDHALPVCPQLLNYYLYSYL